ncbi:MAG: CBS domain-containing protein, partial [Planctomycetota bacterium]
MRVLDLCTLDVVTIEQEALARDAAEKLHAQGVGSLVVVDEHGVGVGLLTDRDLALRGLHGKVHQPAGQRVERFASSPLISIGEKGNLQEALEIMRVRGIRRLPVIDSEGKPAGILTLDDVVGALSSALADLSAEAVAKRRNAIWRGRLDSAKEDLTEALSDVNNRLRST